MNTSKKLMIAVILLLLSGFSSSGLAEVRVNIGINLPPLVFRAPPAVAVIPGTYVYYCPEADVDILFYHGHWYRPYGEHWYQSGSYNGPWGYIAGPPTALLNLPPDYRRVTIEHRWIPYGDLYRNWRAWERGRYWEKHDWGREERHESEHRERGHRERW
jgi:hypothetical protein